MSKIKYVLMNIRSIKQYVPDRSNDAKNICYKFYFLKTLFMYWEFGNNFNKSKFYCGIN